MPAPDEPNLPAEFPPAELTPSAHTPALPDVTPGQPVIELSVAHEIDPFPHGMKKYDMITYAIGDDARTARLERLIRASLVPLAGSLFLLGLVGIMVLHQPIMGGTGLAAGSIVTIAASGAALVRQLKARWIRRRSDRAG